MSSSWSALFFSRFVVVAIFSSLLISSVDAHGYVSSPASRAYDCKLGKASDCGAIQYEPQSVEAPKGLPFARSGGGSLCSAGVSRFSELDRQGPNVWPTTSAADVSSFQWTFTAPHATTDFQYFITKPDWDSTKTSGLDASDFESDPFLTVPMNGQPPSMTMTHDLSKMPQRSGYHVVYAVWTINNTVNAFYQCIDLDFGNVSGAAPASTSASPMTSAAATTSASSQAPAATTTGAAKSGATASDSSAASPSDDSNSDSDNNSGSDSGSDSDSDSDGSRQANTSCSASRKKRSVAAKAVPYRFQRRRRSSSAGPRRQA